MLAFTTRASAKGTVESLVESRRACISCARRLDPAVCCRTRSRDRAHREVLQSIILHGAADRVSRPFVCGKT